jgi:carbon-monoxide dehydrogenase large subunit
MSEFGIGRPVRRVEDAAFLTGNGNYVDDISLPAQSYAYILRSPHPHADIKSIDTEKAAASLGVLAILTGEDVAADGLGGIPCTQLADGGGWLPGNNTFQPLLAQERVRFVGEGVAMVIAETREQAMDAAALIETDYAPLPFVTDARDAASADVPQVWEGAAENLCFQMNVGDSGAVDEELAKAHSVHTVSAYSNRISACPLEPRVTLGDYRLGRYELQTTCQKPHTVRQLLAGAVFHTSEEDLHVICPDVGGGFGLKGTVYVEDALVIWAARKIGRPVKWTATREEGLLADTHARDQLDDGEIALDEEGKIMALRVNMITNVGAYLSISALVPTARSVMNMSNVYAIPAIHVSAKSVFTHTTPLGPYRGAGLPEAVYMVERLLDVAARERGMDPVDLRRRNFIKPDAMPYKTPLQYLYDSGEFEAVMDQCLAAADRDGFAARREESEKQGMLRGMGLGFYIEAITAFSERMEIRVNGNGDVTILAGTFSYGQGHATVYAQMVHDWLGVPLDQVWLVQGDTDRVSMGRGSFGSRSITMGGSALRLAADKIIEKGTMLAAHMLEAAETDIEFADGKFTVHGTDKSVSLPEVARKSFAPVGLPPGSGIGLEGAGYYDGPFNFPNGCHACEVEIDSETGQVRVVNFVSVDDAGIVINPLLTEGQIHGGIAQGLGQALMENITIDPATGQNLSGSLMDYALPRANDLPPFSTEFRPAETKSNPIGVKGAGENGCVGAPAALLNAVLDALGTTEEKELEMPLTGETVWRALNAA